MSHLKSVNRGHEYYLDEFYIRVHKAGMSSSSKLVCDWNPVLVSGTETNITYLQDVSFLNVVSANYSIGLKVLAILGLRIYIRPKPK